MQKHFTTVEELVADDDFLNWYLGTNARAVAEWEAWLAAHPQYQSLAAAGQRLMNSLRLNEKPVAPQQTADAYNSLMQKMDKTPVSATAMIRRHWMAAAAVLLLMAGAALWLLPSGKQQIKSNYGRIGRYNLSDGSAVLLNAASRLSAEKAWKEGENREVWVEGEAFFKVQKKASKNRFIVHAAAFDIVVIGTQFNVVNRDGESSVLLTEGSINLVLKDGRQIQMQPGDFVKTENNTIVKTAGIDTQKLLAWQQEKLVFDNTKMPEAAKIISRYYGIRVTLADKAIEDKSLSGVLPNNNLEVLIAALEATGDFKIIRKEKELLVTKS